MCKIITEEIAEPTTKTKVKALDLIVALTVNGRNGQTVQLLAAQKLSESDYAIYM